MVFMVQNVAEVPVSASELGRAIEDLLRDRGETQRALALFAGIDKSVMSRRLKGEGRPFHQGELNRIANFFGLHSAKELLGLAERKYDRGIPLLGSVPGGTMAIRWRALDEDALESVAQWLDRSAGQTDLDLFAVRLTSRILHPDIREGCTLIFTPIADAPMSERQLARLHDEWKMEGRVCLMVFAPPDGHPRGSTEVGVWRRREDGSIVLVRPNDAISGPLLIDPARVVSLAKMTEFRCLDPVF